MHIGNLRTAIYEYLVAKTQNGKFILRIEDTDQERLVEHATDVIYNTLKLVGLDYDEGPDVGGPFGPYIQSERRPIYKEYAQRLVELGEAYCCFCSKERLEKMRLDYDSQGRTFKYDGFCKNLSQEEIDIKISNHEPYVIRQKISENGQTSFTDLVYGDITVENSQLDEGVLLKSDGMPTYNFANVVDDHLMEITHVIRGSEYYVGAENYIDNSEETPEETYLKHFAIIGS